MKRSRPRNAWWGTALLTAALVPPAHAVAPPSSPDVSASAVPAPSSPAASDSAAGPAFDLADAARIAAGKKRFGANCAAYCHGSEGEGGKTPPFKGRPDFSPAATFKIITEGRRGSDIMPPWGGAFTPEQIWELVAYLQFLSTQPSSR